MEHENGVQALKTWLVLQEEKLKKRNRIEDVASVQNALKDCHVSIPISVMYRKNEIIKLRAVRFLEMRGNIDISGGTIEGKREGSRESRGTRKCSHPESKGTSLLCCH